MREFIFTIAGLLAAALATAVFFAAFSGSLGDFLTFTLLYFGFAFIPAVVFGGMLFVVLRSFHVVRWWSAALGGIAIGALVGTLMPSGSDAARFLVICVSSGAISGLVCWAVWRAGLRHNSRSAKNAPTIDVPSA